MTPNGVTRTVGYATTFVLWVRAALLWADNRPWFGTALIGVAVAVTISFATQERR